MLDPNGVPLPPRPPLPLQGARREHPFTTATGDGTRFQVDYEPAESTTTLFGGNSNWRGPIWMPINVVLIEALYEFEKFYHEDEFTIEYPKGSGQMLCLDEIGAELTRRLNNLFLRDGQGRRAVLGGNETFQTDPHFRDLIPFHEYFHGDDGAGLGASTRPAGRASPPSCSSRASARRGTLIPSRRRRGRRTRADRGQVEPPDRVKMLVKTGGWS